MTNHPSETLPVDTAPAEQTDAAKQPEWVAIAEQHYREKAAVQQQVAAYLAKIQKQLKTGA